MLSFLNESSVKKIREIKEKIDRFYSIGIGCLWTLSTLWDIIRFHCFWSDYMLELYSCFFIVFMVLYLIIPAKVPKRITILFGVITTTFGRGIIMLVFSLLFLGDKHTFHKLCAIFLFIGGFVITILELIAPSLDEDNRKLFSTSNSSYPNEDRNRNDSIPSTKIDDSQPGSEALDKTPNEPTLGEVINI